MSDKDPLTRGDLRKALEAGLAAAESAAFCDPAGPSCSGYRAMLATLDEPTQCAHPTVTLLGNGKVGCRAS